MLSRLLVIGLFAVMTAACGASSSNGDRAGEDASTGSNRVERQVVMPVVFPDGTSADIAYPEKVELDRFAITPWTSGRLPGCCARVLRIRSVDDVAASGEFGNEGEPVRTFEGFAGGPVRLVPAPEGDPSRFNLVFRFGTWKIAVRSDHGAEQMTDEQLAAWARGLKARETQRGFLVVEAEAPLEVSRRGDRAGPELTLSRGARGEPRLIALELQGPGHERSGSERSAGFAAFDVPGAPVRVRAQGDGHFLDAVVEGLRITNVRAGPR